jgi:LysM repeat protein
MRRSWIRLWVLGSCAIGPAHAVALPPPSAALAQSSITGGRSVDHMVIPGERLAEIAERYGVEVDQIVEWNSLDAEKPLLRVGQRLRVLARTMAAPRKRTRYRVQAGDNWSKIARRYEVDTNKLQKQWNPTVGDLRPGDHVIVWVERDAAAVSSAPAPAAAASAAPATPAASNPAATLAAVVEPPHGTASSPAAILAAVVEPKPSKQPEPPQRAASRGSAPQPTVEPPAAVKPAPAPAKPAAAKPAPSKPAAAKPAAPTPAPAKLAKPVSAAGAVAAVVQPSAVVKPSSRSPASSISAAALATVVQPSASKSTAIATKPTATGTSKPSATGTAPAPPRKVGQYTLMPVAAGGQSVGSPSRGRVRNAVQLPANDALYTIRNPDHSWGSSNAVEQLQVGMAIFREQTGFKRAITICDMSLRNGGRFRPHRSHTSGRDVDIRLPLKAGVPEDTLPENPAVVDWDMAWSLIKALVATGEVHYLFLARSRMVHLYKAAQRAGESPEDLTVLIQYPGHGRNTLVRHSAGHTKHMHVRWKCAPDEEQCLE